MNTKNGTLLEHGNFICVFGRALGFNLVCTYVKPTLDRSVPLPDFRQTEGKLLYSG